MVISQAGRSWFDASLQIHIYFQKLTTALRCFSRLIIPYTSAVQLGAYEPPWEDPKDVDWFLSLVKGSKCTLALNMMPRYLTAEKHYRKAHKLGKMGVKHFFFWDGTERV